MRIPTYVAPLLLVPMLFSALLNGLTPVAIAKAASPAPTTYSGHGGASIAPEVLRRYAPSPLPPDLQRRVQAALDIRTPGPGQLSDDGQHLFFPWNVSGTMQVWRLDGPNTFPEQLTGGEEATAILAVLPGGAQLLVARDRNGEENPGIYLLPSTGGALTKIFHEPNVQAHFGFVTDDSRQLYFTANDRAAGAFAVYAYDFATKQRQLLLGQDGLWRIVDHRPASAGGSILLAKDTGGSTREFWELDPASKKLTPLLGQGESEDYEAAYGAHPGELLVVTNKLSDYYRLYSRDGAGKFRPISPEIPHDIGQFTIDPARTLIAYTVNDNGYQTPRALDAQTYVEAAFPDLPGAKVVTIDSTTRDGRYLSLSVDHGTGPAQGFVLDWRTKSLVAWHKPSIPERASAAFAQPTLEYYPARDGTKIPMLVRRPPQCSQAALCPVVVMFHGGPEAQTLPSFSAAAQLFVDLGFVYVAPNVRGSAGYGKTWVHADDGAKRLAVITDIEDCATYLRKTWSAGGKAPKLGVYGGSYGGYSTLMAMTKFAGAYDAGAEVVGMSNLSTFLLNTAAYRRALRISKYGDPVKDREALTQLSPITYVSRIKAPLLMIQGASDPRVPVGEAIQFHDALAARQIAAELIIFPDEGHGAKKRDNLVQQLGHVLAFFQKTLAP